MNSIIITSIICISVIIIVSIFCYISYKNNENEKSNRFFKTVNTTQKQYEIILSNISDIKTLITYTQKCIEYLSTQISLKEKENKNNNKNA